MQQSINIAKGLKNFKTSFRDESWAKRSTQRANQNIGKWMSTINGGFTVVIKIGFGGVCWKINI